MKTKISIIKPMTFVRNADAPHGRPSRGDEKGTHTFFEQYAGKPPTGDHTEHAWYVSSVFEVAIILCSCGKWSASASLDLDRMTGPEPALIAAYEAHAKDAS